MRVDDLDTPRVVPGAEAAILASLEAHGLTWDGLSRQSDHIDGYRAALERLRADCFGCRCSRAKLRGITRYPGFCRDLALPRDGHAVRIRVHRDGAATTGGQASTFTFLDRVQGRYTESVASSVGDFIVWRRDDAPSYQLAVVVDDESLGITHIVRGADLLDNTPRQLYLMARLGYTPPEYAHVPVIATATGVKLSKHSQVTAIDDAAARHNLATVLTLLGLEPPPGDGHAMLDWARRHWDIRRLPGTPAITGFTALV